MEIQPSAISCTMKDGTPYRVQLCLEPGTCHDREYLKHQIAEAMENLSSQSRWLRFSSPVNRLSEGQLDYLSNLDGKNRLAWCASRETDEGEQGIGLGRYVRLEEEGVAEFALTVLDEYQGQGIGRQLLKLLIRSAHENAFETLRGYILKGNLPMLALCRRFEARISTEDSATFRADIDTAICRSFAAEAPRASEH